MLVLDLNASLIKIEWVVKLVTEIQVINDILEWVSGSGCMKAVNVRVVNDECQCQT